MSKLFVPVITDVFRRERRARSQHYVHNYSQHSSFYPLTICLQCLIVDMSPASYIIQLQNTLLLYAIANYMKTNIIANNILHSTFFYKIMHSTV